MCSIWVVEVVVKLTEFLSIKTNGLNTDLEETGDDGFGAVVDFGDSLIVSGAIDTSDWWSFVLSESLEEVFGLLKSFLCFLGSVVRDDNEEGLIHNVCFLGENVDEVDVIIHKDTEKHIIVLAAEIHKAIDIRSNIDALGAN